MAHARARKGKSSPPPKPPARTPPKTPRPRPRARLAPLAAVLLALVGLAVSAALLVDSLQPVPAFCAAGGCEAVRATSWARPLGIPMPVIGLAFFAAALVLAALPRLAAVRTLVALIGAAGGIGLLALQAFVIGEWCRLCVIADLAAIAHGVLVAAGGAVWPRPGRRAIVATAVLAVGAVALPFVAFTPERAPAPVAAAPSTAVSGSPGLPEVVAREQAAGQVVVVDFIDFQCPHCRALHPRLVEAMSRVDVPVRVVRKMVPLPQHAGAMPAAIAWCCADAQGKGDEMAEALLAARVSELTPQGCERMAAAIGLDMDRYRADAADRATRRRIHADVADAHKAGVHALPTIYIGGRAFTDARATVDQIEAALRRAAGAI